MDTAGTECFQTAQGTLEVPKADNNVVEIVEYPSSSGKIVISGHVSAILLIEIPVSDEGVVNCLKDIEKRPNVTSAKRQSDSFTICHQGNGYVTLAVSNGVICRHQISDKLNELGWKMVGYSSTFCPKSDGCLYAEKWAQRGRSRRRSGETSRRSSRSGSRRGSRDTPRPGSRRSSGELSRPGSSRRASAASVQEDALAEFLAKHEGTRRGSLPVLQPL